MPRGRTAEVGTETVNKLGYLQVKVDNGKWVGKHILILEERLGRKLQAGERAIFKDGNKENLDPDNIELVKTGPSSIMGRIARLEAEIADRQALIKDLRAQLEQTSS